MLEYSVNSVEIQSAGTGYKVNDVLTIDLDTDDAKLKVTSVTPDKYAVATATASGTMSGYLTGETITIAGETNAVLTITAEEGAITALTVTTAGVFASDIAGSVTTFTYEGLGTGLELAVTTSTITGGAITGVVITNVGESTTSTVENPVSVTGGTGSGAKVNITLASIFEEVEVTDVPGTMPKPATEVSYVSYSVSYPELPIDYNTTFTREYPVQEDEESGEESNNA